LPGEGPPRRERLNKKCTPKGAQITKKKKDYEEGEEQRTYPFMHGESFSFLEGRVTTRDRIMLLEEGTLQKKSGKVKF